MLHRTLALASATIVVWMLSATSAHAVSQRTFVAPTGSDANPCSLAAPCRSFSAAIAQTATGGEVIVLDSAGYGPVTITQSVSIIAPPGLYAGVSVASGNGITINDPAAVVTLKGLTINGQGGTDGIAFLQGTRLTIEGCTVSGMTGNGITVSAAGSFTAIADVLAKANNNGIVLSGDVRVSIVRARAESNAFFGIQASNGATVAITDSEASRNIGAGLRAEIPGAGTTTVSIDRFTATANQSGIDVAAQGIGGTTIVDAARVNLSGNSIDGVEMYGPSAFGVGLVSVTDSLIAGNGIRGIFISAPPTGWRLTVGNNRIVNHSGAGIFNTSNIATVLTRGDNTMSGNNPNLSGTTSPLGGN